MPIFSPQKGIQEDIVRSNVDVAFAGAGGSTGKTFAFLMAVGQYIHIPEFRALFFRRTLGEVGAVGGMVDELKRLYDFKRITESRIPEMEFDSGAKIMLSHLANEDPEYLRERMRGYQADFMFLDELTSYEFSTFSYLLSRNRGSAGIGGKFRGAYNPKRSHWTRQFVDWYIGEDGYPIEERIGVVRYFFITQERNVEGVVWGNTKEEVYSKEKWRIDKMIHKSKGKATYKDFIKSFAFYTGDIYENAEFLKSNPNYIASLASGGDTLAAQLLLNNHNVDEDDYIKIPIPTEVLYEIFKKNYVKTEDKVITADIALGGDDNFVAIVWDNLMATDIIFKNKLTADEALRSIRLLQARHGIPDSRVVFDGISIGEFIGGAYGVITSAINFKAGATAIGFGKHNYTNLKAQCADKLIAMIKAGAVGIHESIQNTVYKSKFIKEEKLLKDVLFDEFRVLRMETVKANGKLRLMAKDEQKKMLSGRSPDLMDNLIMLMYFYLDKTDKEYEKEEYQSYESYKENDDILDFLEAGDIYF